MKRLDTSHILYDRFSVRIRFHYSRCTLQPIVIRRPGTVYAVRVQQWRVGTVPVGNRINQTYPPHRAISCAVSRCRTCSNNNDVNT